MSEEERGKMQKILFVATVPSTIKAFSLEFMKFLRNRGYDVSAATAEGSEADDIRKEGFRCHEVGFSREIAPRADLSAFRALKSIMSREKFDLVHTQTAKAGFIGRLAARKARIPLVVHTSHAWPFHPLSSLLKRRFYLALERMAASWCDAIIVDTEAVKRYGVSCAVCRSEKIHRIYMGIDTDRFFPYSAKKNEKMKRDLGISRDKTIIGTISRLVPDKGIETLLACARGLKDNKDIVFIIGGEGPLRERFEREVYTYGLQDKVIFTGNLEDVVPYLNVFDIFCLPTLREGFGVIFAEAQACGTPVVASLIPPLKKVVRDGLTGILVPPGDTKGFIRALKELLEIPVRERMGRCARKHVKDNFASGEVNEATLDLYRRLWGVKKGE